MKLFQLAIVFLLIIGISACSSKQKQTVESESVKPNVVIIYIDDLGYGDVSCYGATKVSTPNIDNLAAIGIRFTNGHSSSATCTPSRFSMLTGGYAFRQEGIGIAPGDAAMIIKPET
ncbi:MAG TPA: sulfatase-like hydrolase/transferase, partial [Draconibacterium sp.]|nr:sulfatase-like hydrolase/transferase [Draconibacterium sp.]